MNSHEEKLVDIIREKHHAVPWNYNEERRFEKEYGKVFSAAINNFFVSTKEIAGTLLGDPEAASNMSQLAGCWLKVLGYQNSSGIYDGRNECSVKTGAQLMENEKIQEFVHEQCEGYTPYDRQFNKMDMAYTFAMYASDYMSHEHRTLQQTFSGIVFCFLRGLFPELTSVGGNEYWEKCPMI